jgi:hypothetical protein
MNKRIEETITEAREKGIAHISTCDAPNWNREEHDGMLMLVRNQPDDVEVSYNKNHGVWDWNLIRIGERKPEKIVVDKAKDYTLKLNFELLRSQKQGLMAILNDDNNKEAVEHYHLEGLLAVIDNIQDQAVDQHGIPEKEVFNITDDGSDHSESSDDDCSIQYAEPKQYGIFPTHARMFDAYQHFLYYFDADNFKENSPFDQHMTNHFMEKLAGYRSLYSPGCNGIEALVTWLQNMTFDYQDKMIGYMLRFHTGKGGGFRSWDK